MERRPIPFLLLLVLLFVHPLPPPPHAATPEPPGTATDRIRFLVDSRQY
jgi:hypothetical protein